MAEEMLKYYNTLTAEQQKEAFDFIIFLWLKSNRPDLWEEITSEVNKCID